MGTIKHFLIFVVVIFLSFIGLYIYVSLKNKDLISNTSKDISEVMDIGFSEIDSYLSLFKKNTLDLTESNEVKETLNKEKGIDDNVAKNDVDIRSKQYVNEVKQFLLFHPDLTLSQLQENEDFQSIAVQSIGLNDYSLIMDTDNNTIYFHYDKSKIGLTTISLSAKNKEMIQILDQLQKGKNVLEKFYNWTDENGEIRKRYGRFVVLPNATADGKNLTLTVATYVDNYKVVNDINSDFDEYLTDFIKKNEYEGIILTSADGYFVYTNSKTKVGLGTNFLWQINNNYKTKENLELFENNIKTPIFSGPFISVYGDLYPTLAFTSPVFENNVLLGYLLVIDEMDSIYNILSESMSNFNNIELYLTDNENLVISPLTYGSNNIFVQKSETDNTKKCIENLEIGEEEKDLMTFINFRGDETWGKNYPITKMRWCLLAEVNKKNQIDNSFNEKLEELIFKTFFISIILTILIEFLFFLKKKKFFLILFFISLVGFISLPPKVSALDVNINIPEKYTEINAGERIYFEIDIKYPENQKRKDLQLIYQIKKDGDLIAESKVLKAVETQASFIDFIVIPDSSKSGIYKISIQIQDYADLAEEVAATFNVVAPIDQFKIYFFIILGVVLCFLATITWQLKGLYKFNKKNNTK